MTIEALNDFVLTQGGSRNVNLMSWDKVWTINKQKIDPVVPRYPAIVKATAAKLYLQGAPTIPVEKKEPLHPKNVELGMFVLPSAPQECWASYILSMPT